MPEAGCTGASPGTGIGIAGGVAPDTGVGLPGKPSDRCDREGAGSGDSSSGDLVVLATRVGGAGIGRPGKRGCSTPASACFSACTPPGAAPPGGRADVFIPGAADVIGASICGFSGGAYASFIPPRLSTGTTGRVVSIPRRSLLLDVFICTGGGSGVSLRVLLRQQSPHPAASIPAQTRPTRPRAGFLLMGFPLRSVRRSGAAAILASVARWSESVTVCIDGWGGYVVAGRGKVKGDRTTPALALVLAGVFGSNPGGVSRKDVLSARMPRVWRTPAAKPL